MAYLKGRVAQEEYNKALMERHPLMNAAQNASTQAMWTGAHTGASIGTAQAWPSNPGILQANLPASHPYEPSHTRQFAVEKVDNGFIIRSGKYSKICKDMTELSEQFVAIMVEAQLDK
jgi:hypothetical protein